MFIQFGIVSCIVILGSNGQVSSDESSSGIFFPSPATDECSTRSGISGECVILNSCSFLMSLLTHSPSDNSRILTDSNCGYVGSTPKVCCPSHSVVQSPTPTAPGAVPSHPDVTNHAKLGLINDENCGPMTQSRIMFGNGTSVLEFPWMALLGYRIDGRGINYQCGGTLINKRYVLTAAHCVTGLGPSRQLVEVRLGEHDLSTEQDCDVEGGVRTVCADRYQDFLIESSHAHPNYPTTPGYGNDIALIRINRDADYTASNVRPICLPVGGTAILRSRKAIVTGWGGTESGARSSALLKVTLQTVSNEECFRVFQPLRTPIGYKQLCAGGTDGRDSCGGDSGGPLQYPAVINGESKYIQHGIVSFGLSHCGTPGYPGVYTRVAYYMDWILDTIIS